MENRNILMKNQNLIACIAIVFFGATIRLLPHPANFAPIAAMALFGGYYLDKKYAFIVPITSLFISDLFLGFHSTMPFVYGSFLLTGVIGILIKKQSKILIPAASLLSSLLFFIVTNFGVWLVGGLYPKTLNGLADAYTLAIPFFRNTLLGDLSFTFLFFGSFMLISYFLQVKKPVPHKI